MLATLASLMILAAAANAAAPVPGPPTYSKAESDSLRRAIDKDREQTEAWLRAGTTSYLATIQRVEYLWRDRLVVGREAGDVRLDDPAIRREHLQVTVVGDSFRVEALDDSATFRVGGREEREAVLGPSSIEVGRYTIRLSHQRYPALIVFDPRSPRFALYKGIDYFPIDLSWRYVLPLTAPARVDTVVIVSTRGFQRRAARAGWFEFMAGGTRCRLEAHRLLEPGVGENDLAVFFRDATTGEETYPVGRYLDPVRLPDGRYVLDFNMAYNPACAYSEHYNCPIPPRTNRLPVEVRAGEKDAHYLEYKPGW